MTVRKILAITILLAVLLQTFSQLVVLADYYANKDYIAKNLCENRNKPYLHCEGKCCLKKKLDRDSKQQSPAPFRQKLQEVQSLNLFIPTQAFSFTIVADCSEEREYFLRNELFTASFPRNVFHPPSA